MEFSELILKVNEWFKNHSDAEINDILNNIKITSGNVTKEELIKIKNNYFNDFRSTHIFYTESELFDYAFDKGYKLGIVQNISNVSETNKKPKFKIGDLVLYGGICKIIDYNQSYELPYQLDNGLWVMEEMLTPYGNS